MNKTTPPEIIQKLMEYLNAKDDWSILLDYSPFCAPTGSRVICNPPVLNTDNDWLVYVPASLRYNAINFLEDNGATHSEEQDSYPDGVCFRYGDINPILIWDYKIFYRWVATTYWAAKLNLQDKELRTSVFAALVDESVPLNDLIL